MLSRNNFYYKIMQNCFCYNVNKIMMIIIGESKENVLRKLHLEMAFPQI